MFPLHICHVWERFWPLEIGGLERYILGLTTYLAKNRGVTFSLVTGRTKFLLFTKNIKKFEDTGFLKVYRLGPKPVDLVKGAFMYVFGSMPKPVERMKFSSLCHEAANWEYAKSADAFHIHGIWEDLEYINLGIYLSRHFQKPLVLTLHGAFVGDPLLGGMPLESSTVKSILENDVAAITTYSKEVFSVLGRMGLGEKSYYITNFVDTTYFNNNGTTIPPYDTTVIYVGRFEPVQTPEMVVKAFKQVNTQFPNTELILVGYGTMFDDLKNLIKELNLEASVSMVGKQTDVRPYLWNSDIFVATNFGYIATLEALSAGIAVVAPHFGVLKETISHGNNGLLFEPENATDLASALLTLIKDKELREKIALNGAHAAKDYDIRSVAPKMFEVYRSVIN